MRWLAPILTLTALLAACAHDPIRYIPETDRTMLQAQDRLGTGEAAGAAISVDEMLRRAKASEHPVAAATRVMIRFDGDAVQPDAAQRDQLRKFVAGLTSSAVPIVVASRPGNFDDPGTPVLGQRRAMAVSRELTGLVADVTVRFEANLPPGVVVVSLDEPPHGATAP